MTLCCDFLPCGWPVRQGERGVRFCRQARHPCCKSTTECRCICWKASPPISTLCRAGRSRPRAVREHKLGEVSFFGPCRPMMSLIEQQVWLARGVREGDRPQRGACCAGARPCTTVGGAAGPHPAGGGAAALRPAGRRPGRAGSGFAGRAAGRFLGALLEQYPAPPLLEEEDWAVCEPRLGPFVASHPARRPGLCRPGWACPPPRRRPPDRPRPELACLVAGRCTNKEIAALYLSEGTVKQYINQLYAKLDMGGDPAPAAPGWRSGTRKKRPPELTKN